MLKEVPVKSSSRNQLIDITGEVRKLVSQSKVKEGTCLVYIPHTTAGVTINENADPDVKKDILKKLSSLIPEHESYSHAEGNSDAHIKSSLVGCNLSVPIKDSSLVLGTWQGILFCEFDGPRNRKAIIQIIKSD